ncbi:MAG TPA: DUF222 domain-containing protein, partial [Acidimicrobiia bacterium]|nr:DUF222 domain-containing protein [Acidimicrobiia bacterium]
SALEAWRTEDLDSRDAESLADDLVELELISGQLELERARRVAAFEAKQGQDLEGHSSITAFLKHRCRMTGGRAQRTVSMAHKLPRLEFMEKAASTGDVSLDQVRVLLDVPDHLLDALSRDEVTLVNAVRELSVSDTRRVVDYWRTAVDGPGTEAGADDLCEQRYLYASRTMGGMVKGDFLLDPLAGEVVLEALAAVIPPRREGDERTPRQRRADGLTDLARAFLDSGEAPGRETPHLLVLTDLDALQGKGGGVHETVSGQVLTPEQVRMLACDATITRIVFGPDGQPVDVGRATRVIPPTMRRAVIARDRHCQHQGCDRPARWCDVHHVVHWADGGKTAIIDLKLLCRYHHVWHHRHPSQPP